MEQVRATKNNVTPYVGVWIETNRKYTNNCYLWSLLMWECGLKPLGCGKYLVEYKSLLMWECGLKLKSFLTYYFPHTSLLMWECGLKHSHHDCKRTRNAVTPYVGVWIETRESEGESEHAPVTPYVGVWIETVQVFPYHR